VEGVCHHPDYVSATIYSQILEAEILSSYLFKTVLIYPKILKIARHATPAYFMCTLQATLYFKHEI
jgi:hypothetical protein